MSDAPVPFRRFLSLREMAAQKGVKLSETADEAERAAIATAFGLPGVASFETSFAFRPEGADAWRLDGEVRARFTQECVVTLQPVGAKVAESFTRVFSPDGVDPFADPSASIDFDLEEEDPAEPLGDGVDVGAVALEALALAIDPYPRAPDAAFASVSARPEGAEEVSEEKVKPFAGLAALKKAMDNPG